MENSLVSIITVNHNGWQDTLELIASLKRMETYPYEVIVVDNASEGDDAEKVQRAYTDVKVVRSETNLGFAGGNNLGYQYARGAYILFLNNDTVLKAPLLSPLVNRLADKRIGGVSPCIFFYHHPDSLQYYGYQDMTPITLRHTTEKFSRDRMDEYMRPKQTDILHGAAMMVRRDVIEKVGMMPEIYFLFYEEFDWSLRIREGGYILYYEPAAQIYHKEGMSLPLLTPFREYYLYRSRMLFARRNNKSWRKVLSCLYLLSVVIPKKTAEYVWKRRIGLVGAVVKGICSGLFADKERRAIR